MSFKSNKQSNKSNKSNISPLSQYKIDQIKRNMNRFESVDSYTQQLPEPQPMYGYKALSQWHHRQFNILSQKLKNSTQKNCEITLFCGNLNELVEEKHLYNFFKNFKVVECCKKWQNFGFVKFHSEENACTAYITMNGRMLMGKPIRIEFQDKKKCPSNLKVSSSILNSQASETNTLTSTLLSSLITSLISSSLNDNPNSKKNTFIDTNQLIKFACSENITNDLEQKQSEEVEQCEYCSSSSSDSGCLSTSSLNEDDYINNDTSDDASEIPTDVESLNDLEIVDECLEAFEAKRFVYCLETDRIVKKALEYGIYCSVNKTSSLFIKPKDILVKIDSDQINEYVLFPRK